MTSLVQPGDRVKRGDTLAQMDGREIRWQRASLLADRDQAVKKRDAAQASHDYAEAQISRLETERLDLQLELLDHRAQHLDIKSPIAGCVASGDLDRVQGAPLKTGQTLFEIAPLSKMIVEVAIPDHEVRHVRAGHKIEMRLNAFPKHVRTLVVTKVYPRAEIRDHENVFIAEATLDNADGNVRPGMKGRANVITARRPLVWILFHKPWEYLTKRLSW